MTGKRSPRTADHEPEIESSHRAKETLPGKALQTLRLHGSLYVLRFLRPMHERKGEGKARVPAVFAAKHKGRLTGGFEYAYHSNAV